MEVFKGKTALIVDDKVDNIVRLTKILEKCGMEYHTCQCAKLAITLFISNPRYKIDIGLIDIMMPIMDGNELADYIAKTDRKFPLIALSSANAKTTEISGAFDISLSKPYAEDRLIKSIYSLLKIKKKKAPSNVPLIDIEKTKRKRANSISTPKNTSRHITSRNKINSPLFIENVNIKILVVEDNYFNQKTIERMLKTLGYVDITIADGGKQALEIITSNADQPISRKSGKFNFKSAFDVILMDIIMPEMDGFQTTKAIDDIFRHKRYRPKIIAVTANVMAGDKEKCLSMMDGYISKPIDKERIGRVLSKI